MDALDKDKVPMLSDDYPFSSDGCFDSQPKRLAAHTRSASTSIPMNFEASNSDYLVSHTGPLRSARRNEFLPMSGSLHVNPKPGNLYPSTQGNLGCNSAEGKLDPSFLNLEKDELHNDNYVCKTEHLLRSGPLGMCNDPYCTTCPTYNLEAERKYYKASNIFDPMFPNALYGDAVGWAKRLFYPVWSYVPGVMNPHARIVQRWNKLFVICCLAAIFVDPLFFLLLSVRLDYKCIMIDWPTTRTIVGFRSLLDFIYVLHMLIQFRLAYIAPESRVVGAGELVDHPRKIALHYLRGYFLLDFLVVLPLPQIMIYLVLPKFLGSSGANYAKNSLRASVLAQYIPRLYRFLPLIVGLSPSGFVFESAWGNFVINLLTVVLCSHIVGSCWYLFGLQRVNQCLRDACHKSFNTSLCLNFIDCGRGNVTEKLSSEPLLWATWRKSANALACFDRDGFAYGIYVSAVNLTTESSIVKRYTYSLFWGLQQISTLAGNQIPSYFVWEVVFTMGIIALGLLLFAFLIGNMQNFLQALGRRRVEMLLRRLDVEQWMKHRHLPAELRSQIREAERYNWAATRGVNEELLLRNWPDDLRREIRRHLFKFIKKVRILDMMDQPILDLICERLQLKTYIKGCHISYRGGLVDKMVFIVRGTMESKGEDGIMVPLGSGDVCGEELLTWCLENSSMDKDGRKMKTLGKPLISNRVLRCLTHVEAFILRAADLEEVTNLFARVLRNPRVQGAIRYQSPYWRSLAANRIQVAWRYYKKRLNQRRL